MNANNTLSVWNNGFGPLGELRREMGRLFDDFITTAPVEEKWRRTESEWRPACDVEESDDHYLLSLDVPGIPKEQIKLEVIDNQILISGERRHEAKGKTDGAWYTERHYGKFQRSFALPVGVDTTKVEADYRDGTLRIYVPKAESTKPRQIKITSGSAPGFFGKLIGQSSSKEKEEKNLSSDHSTKDRVAS